MKIVIKIVLLLLVLSSYGQNQIVMNTPKMASKKFEQFIVKEKFLEESYPNFYPGISDEKLRPLLTERINEVANDFKQISESKNPTKDKYLKAIKIGLLKFPELELGYDSEDKDRILSYFEELMDIVGLESSNGQLNKFRYGFSQD